MFSVAMFDQFWLDIIAYADATLNHMSCATPLVCICTRLLQYDYSVDLQCWVFYWIFSKDKILCVAPT